MTDPLINVESLLLKLRWAFNRLLILFFFILAVIYGSREIMDLDIWLHLKAGEIIATTHSIPLRDIFSFTLQGKEWINHEWLFQLVSHLFYRQGGADALIFMQNLVVLTLFFVLFFMGIRKENHLLVFGVLYITLLTVAYRFTIRPDIFSLLFLAIYLAVIASFLDSGHKSLWILPFVQCLWTNMHGFAFTGPLILVMVLVADMAKKTCPMPTHWKNDLRLDRNRLLQLVIVTGLVLVALLANPQGIKGAIYPLSVLGQLSGKGKIIFNHIQELAQPITWQTLATSHWLYYKIMILLSLFSFRFNIRRLGIWELLLWLFFLMFSLIAIRNVAYFGIVAAFLIFRNIHTALDHGKKLPALFLNKKIKNWGYAACVALFIYYPAKGGEQYLSATNYNFDTYDARGALWGVAETRYPRKAVDFLLREPFPKKMFNDFNAGAYLIGRAYPKRQVFIDGRTEFYGPAFFDDYVKFCYGQKDVVEEMIKRYDIQGFFLTNPNTDIHWGLLCYLGRSHLWKPVYLDESAVIFLKNSPANRALIDRFGIDFEHWSPPAAELMKIGIAQPYPYPYINRGRMLSRLKFHKAAAREARAALEIAPACSEAFRILMEASLDEKKFKDAYQYARLNLLYDTQNTFVRSRLALIYHNLGDDEKALKIAGAVIKKMPKSAEGYYVKSLIRKDANIREAIALMRKAVDLAPRYADAWQSLGDFLAETGDKDGAKKAYEAALVYDASNDTLKRKCGRLV